MTGARRWAGPAAAVLALICLFLAPAWLKPDSVQALSLWVVAMIAAVGLNLTVGYAGQVSLAQGAFVGIGAYATAMLSARGWSLASAFALSGVVCFVIAVPLGLLALRAHRHGLAFATLAFGVLAHLAFVNAQGAVGAASGIAGVQHPGNLDRALAGVGGFHRMCVAALVIASAFAWWVARSPWGRAFRALRENPVRAGTLGVDARRYVLAAFAVGAAFGGLAGALYAPLMQQFDPLQFTPGLSVKLLLIVVLGGGVHFLGPFIGGLFVLLLTEWLHFGDGATLMILAVAVMAMLAIWPAGLLGRRAMVAVRADGIRAMTAVLEVIDLRKSRDGGATVDGVSFALADGEMLGIVGPNGGGKSTLFDCITGRASPTGGDVLLDGRAVAGMRACDLSRRGIGSAPATPQAIASLSVRENLILAGQERQGTMLGRLFGRRDAGQSAAAQGMIERFHLSDWADKAASELGLDEQRMLDVAMAFMGRPRVVLLDEPTGGISLAAQNDLADRLRGLNAEQRASFIVIEHNLEFAVALCTRVLVMAAGKVVAEATPDKLRHDPKVIEAYLGH